MEDTYVILFDVDVELLERDEVCITTL